MRDPCWMRMMKLAPSSQNPGKTDNNHALIFSFSFLSYIYTHPSNQPPGLETDMIFIFFSARSDVTCFWSIQLPRGLVCTVQTCPHVTNPLQKKRKRPYSPDQEPNIKSESWRIKTVDHDWTKPSWSSPESSSRDLPLVSGSKKVLNRPVNMKPAKIWKMWSMNWSFPPISFSLAKPTWAMIAPSLPEAAEIPWEVDLYRVGKHSPGMTKVVVLGPKFWKKLARQ